MDFFNIKEDTKKNGVTEIFPDFKVVRSNDLMIRGRSFYAIWDAEKGMWSTDEYDVQRLVDNELLEYRNKLIEKNRITHIKFMSDFSTNAWTRYRTYLNNLSDNSHQLDRKLTFLNTKVNKRDYVSRRLPYSLEKGECDAYDQIMEVLYEPEEKAKLEWAIGSIIAGDSVDIQKFIVLYGEGGSGKSTFLNIVQKLFPGYYTTFEAKALTSSANTFSTEVFRHNPLIAIQHDGDLSKIEDSTKLNSIISHEEITMNEKYKPSYTAKANCFLFMATNKPVKISDAKSGIIRRLIDVQPSGKRIPTMKYHSLMSRIDFELGAIAYKCLQIYQLMGKNYYSAYRPLNMIFETDVFFNFIEAYYFVFKNDDGISLSQAYSMYKAYCDESELSYKMPRYKFRDEFKNYFREFHDIIRIEGKQIRSYYSGFKVEKFKDKETEMLSEDVPSWIVMDSDISLLDEYAKEFPAQYASRKTEAPLRKWDKVTSVLGSIDTSRLHYVKLPSNHIVIDFDIRDIEGNKQLDLNILEATKMPPTYVEYSKSKEGLHLHYFYDGDPYTLSSLYSEGIEIKVFKGDSALRRKLSKCNTLPIATISGGFPLKRDKMINFDSIKSEKGLRDLIKRNLNKEIHPYTKPSIDFIYKILKDVYDSGMHYDVTDLRNSVLSFAMKSTNQSSYCVDLVAKMNFKSEEPSLNLGNYEDSKLVFFDVEVFPNLFLVSWKYEGKDSNCIHHINPSAREIEELFKLKLVGFNCRRYDNHLLYACYIGYNNEQLYKLSTDIIDGKKSSFFGEAFGISYTDIYDFSSIKQSLKKFQIDLGIIHKELGLPFDQSVPEELWPLVIEYCDNDVISTEEVFNSRKQDFVARQILSDLSGLTVNDTTQTHAAKIIFGDVKEPQKDFVYTDLSELFPGYIFEAGKSWYRDEDPGEGGYVYAEPGYYENVALLDVASMHPTSIKELNLFGPYTKKYNQLTEARLAIKHKSNEAKFMFDGALAKYLKNEEDTYALAYALKIIINIVYGLTSAKFPNKFRDLRNVDNIVAKRGALFMIDCKHMVWEEGRVVHIKTDSIKIPNATNRIINMVFEFGRKYGYEFEHEITYDKFLLVNDAVYIAKSNNKWIAVGAEFAHPYVFKTLFSGELIKFEDKCETKSVTTSLYLNMNSDLDDIDNLVFVGRTGLFCPVKSGGGELLRKKNNKYYHVTGTKGYRWLEASMVQELGLESEIDESYYYDLVDKARAHINKFVDVDVFRL